MLGVTLTNIFTLSFGLARLGTVEDEGVVVAAFGLLLVLLLALLVLFLFFFLLASLALSDCHVLRYYCAEGHAGFAVLDVTGFLLFWLGGQQLAQLVAFGAAIGTVELRSRSFLL